MSDKDLTQPQQASLLCLPAVTEECVLNVALSQTQSGYPVRQWLNCTIKMFALLTNI